MHGEVLWDTGAQEGIIGDESEVIGKERIDTHLEPGESRRTTRGRWHRASSCTSSIDVRWSDANSASMTGLGRLWRQGSAVLVEKRTSALGTVDTTWFQLAALQPADGFPPASNKHESTT